MAEQDLPAEVRAVLPAGWRLTWRMETSSAGRLCVYILTDVSGTRHERREWQDMRLRFRAGATAFDAMTVAAMVTRAGHRQREG